jgi:two-component system cell cycle response regulator
VNLRNREETRQLPILILVEEMETDRLAKALEIGVTDYLVRPIDRNELLARTRTQIRRKRYQDRLRSNLQESMTLAVTDSLTGLHNRRYFASHADNAVAEARDGGKPVAVCVLDIDHFKSVNDTHGHGVGDEVLRQFAERITHSVRGVDLAARFGGEEFVVLLPDTDLAVAVRVAERLRRCIASEPMSVSTENGKIEITCSIGVTACIPGETAQDMLKRADDALYAAKHQGRNVVVVFDEQGDEVHPNKMAAGA